MAAAAAAGETNFPSFVDFAANAVGDGPGVLYAQPRKRRWRHTALTYAMAERPGRIGADVSTGKVGGGGLSENKVRALPATVKPAIDDDGDDGDDSVPCWSNDNIEHLSFRP